METVFARLNQHQNDMKYNPPLAESVAREWEGRIPAPLLELYRFFNGGELFVPGTLIFGLTGAKDDLIRFNRSEARRIFDIPESYLVFAQLNFGDFICINSEEPFDLIQWDHETNEAFNEWGSLKEWLTEAIEDYETYLEDVN